MKPLSSVVIDPARCVGCGLCAADCPAGVLQIENGTAQVTRACLSCGHCAAICPQNAVSLPELDMADVTPYDPAAFAVEPQNLLNAMKYRRSVRHYQDKPIPTEVLTQILEAGRHAPTAKNVQDVQFLALQADLPAFRQAFWGAVPQLADQCAAEKPMVAHRMRRFAQSYQSTGTDPLFFDAPVLLIGFGGQLWDAGLAAGYMEVMAAANGVGILHDGYLQYALGLMPQLLAPYGLADKPITCCMLAGYPVYSYARTAPRKPAQFLIR